MWPPPPERGSFPGLSFPKSRGTHRAPGDTPWDVTRAPAVLTVCAGSAMLRTKAVDSAVQERTVSVRPSRNSRVMDASYVRQNWPLSCSTTTAPHTSSQNIPSQHIPPIPPYPITSHLSPTHHIISQHIISPNTSHPSHLIPSHHTSSHHIIDHLIPSHHIPSHPSSSHHIPMCPITCHPSHHIPTRPTSSQHVPPLPITSHLLLTQLIPSHLIPSSSHHIPAPFHPNRLPIPTTPIPAAFPCSSRGSGQAGG